MASNEERFAEKAAVVRARMQLDHDRIQDMVDVRDRYNGDWVVPVPDVEGKESLPAPVPYLMAEAIDATAMRAASVMPYVEAPAVVRASGLSQADLRAYARTRRRAHYARWDYSALDLLLARGFRHHIGYGSMALAVVPIFEDKRAKIVLRDPLTAYPEPRDPEDVRPPVNVAFVYARSRDWLANRYPEAREHLGKHGRPSSGGDELWDVIEWIDAEDIFVGLLGPRYQFGRDPWTATEHGTGPQWMLRRWANRAGICTAYVPQRVTLNKVMSQVAKMVPVSDLWAKMMALDVVAAEKSIFTDKYALATENGHPTVVSGGGTWQDGRTGEINLLEGVQQVGTLNDGPGAAAQPVIDRLERAIRINTGANPQFSGENPSSLRTGRALESMQAMAIDPRIQEVHTTAKYALKAVNEMCMAVEEGYWPNTTMQVFSGWHVDPGLTEYVPAKHFQSDEGGRANTVAYAVAGADINQTTLAVGQSVGSGLMSRQTGRRIHPLIPDAELEQELIDSEALRQAVLTGFSQQAVAGGIALVNGARIAQDLADGKDALQAIIDENERQQAEAAEQAAAQQEQGGQPGPPAPEQMPGIQPEADAARAAASPQASQALAPVPPPSTSLERLRQLSNAMRARPNG